METMLVVGGGLGGCLLAIYLARRGYKVEVYERQADPRRTTRKRQALNLTLCERGLRALAEVDLRERIELLAVPARGRRIHGLGGELTYQPYGNAGEAIYSIARSDLNDALMSQAESERNVHFHFGQKCLGVDLSTPSVLLEDDATGAKTRVNADRVFGADGAYSSVRSHLQKTELFNYSQQYLDQGYKSLRIPELPDGSQLLEREVLHIWPRGTRMLIGFPNRDGSTSCSLLLPFEGEASFASLRTPELLEHFFQEWFPDAAPLIPELSEQFFAQPPNSLLTIRCRPWSFHDKVLLIGDAAHAVLPSHGQGANAAFEDCQILGRCLDAHAPDFQSVFHAFEQARRPSLDFMADLCVEHFSELCQLVLEPSFLKRREIERDLGTLHPTLYQPLYSMITFSTTSYEDAKRVDQRQRAVVDRILQDPQLAANLDSDEVRRLLAESQGEAARRQ